MTAIFDDYVNTKQLITLLRISEGKRAKVLCFLLEHRTSNYVHATYSQIADDLDVTRKMVSLAIKDYINTGLVKKKMVLFF